MRTFQRENWPSVASSGDGGWNRQSLKQDYLNCLGHLAANTGTLKGSVLSIVHFHIDRHPWPAYFG